MISICAEAPFLVAGAAASNLYMVYQLSCDWHPANHYLFQCANVFLFFSYITPNSSSGLLYLRFVLAGAGYCFCAWGLFILCSPDTFIWNLLFGLCNTAHLIYLLLQRRTKKFSFQDELVYQSFFESIGVKRFQYKPLTTVSKTRLLRDGENYAEENISLATQLSVILSGSIVVSQRNHKIRTIKGHEFVDSPEWIQGNGRIPANYEVTLTAGVNGATLLTWERSELLRVLKRDLVMKNIFDSVVGKDLALKLLKQNETVLTVFEERKEIGTVNASFYSPEFSRRHMTENSDFGDDSSAMSEVV